MNTLQAIRHHHAARAHPANRQALEELIGYAVSRGARYRTIAGELDMGTARIHELGSRYRQPDAILRDPCPSAWAPANAVEPPIPGQTTIEDAVA